MYVVNFESNTVSVISTTPQPADTLPPDTIITSAVDGNKKAVTNGGSTLYSSIRFTFSGIHNVAVTRFQCSLDNEIECASRVVFNNIAIRTHTFQIRAIGTSNNPDQTPASFICTIVTPSQETLMWEIPYYVILSRTRST